MFAFKKSFLFFWFILSSLSYAGTIDPNIPDKNYIEFGSKFYCVVKVCGSYEDDSLFCASGVIIDKRFVLTAAHVVEGYKTCYVKIEDKKYLLKSILIHKDFNTDFGTADIAIGFCEEGFTEIKFHPPLYNDTDEVKKVCSISGWGLTGNFNTGSNKSDNKLRAGSNTIDSIYKDLLVCSPSKPTDADYTKLEYMICSGDSGGGLFIEGKLAGINSCIMAVGRSPMSKYGEESGHTRISKFIEWINESKKQMDTTSKRK